MSQDSSVVLIRLWHVLCSLCHVTRDAVYGDLCFKYFKIPPLITKNKQGHDNDFIFNLQKVILISFLLQNN